MVKYIYTVCTGRCGQVSLANYINKYSINTVAEAEPPEPKYNEKFIFSNFVRNIERKTYASNELLGRGKALIWHDINSNNDLIRSKLNWDTKISLKKGLEKTYSWIENQIKSNLNNNKFTKSY